MYTISDFYKGKKNPDGLYITDILNFSDQQLEKNHKYIQYLFPTSFKSRHNIIAPILTQEDVLIFKKDVNMRELYIKAIRRMLAFYGFFVTKEGKVEYMENFKLRFKNVMDHPHNFLRITRILTSLVQLNFLQVAYSLGTRLCEIRNIYPIPNNTFEKWTNVLGYTSKGKNI